LYLLVQPKDIATRWQDQAPGINIRWLKEHGALQEIGTWGAYTLQQFRKRGDHSAIFPVAEASS